MSPPRLVLASSSPRRQTLLAMAGYEFESVVPDVDETPWDDESPQAMVVRLAVAKAEAVVAGPDRVVLAADTTVVVDGEVLGKPGGVAEAAEMLQRIAGRTHRVLTGCAVATSTGSTESAVAISVVSMRPVTEQEALRYARSGEPLDKAGAYALQGAGRAFVANVEGPRSNVVGLPLDVVVPLLERHGVPRGAPRPT